MYHVVPHLDPYSAANGMIVWSSFTAMERVCAQVTAKRRGEPRTILAVTEAFSEGLAAYSTTAGSASKSELWDRGGLEPLPNFMIK